MKSHEKKWLGYGAAGLAVLLLARPGEAPRTPLPPKAAPKPGGKPKPASTGAGKEGDVISYFFDPQLGQIFIKTHESPDVEWGAPRLKPDKVREFQTMVGRWKTLIDDVGTEFRVPSAEIEAIMWSESKGDPRARSGRGAMGLLQVMPFNFPAGTTEAQMVDPKTNLRTGVKLLTAARNKGKDLVQMASWYNAGGRDGEPWTNEAWLAAKRNPAQTTRWGYAAEPSYLDTVVAAFNTAMALERGIA